MLDQILLDFKGRPSVFRFAKGISWLLGGQNHQAIALLHHGLWAERLLFLLSAPQVFAVFGVGQIGLGALGSQVLCGFLGVGQLEGEGARGGPG